MRRARPYPTKDAWDSFEQHCSREYLRGYRDGLAGIWPEHIPGKPEALYRPAAYPYYVHGHKAGRAKRRETDTARGLNL